MSNEDILSLDDIQQIAVSACGGDETVEVIDHHLEPFSAYKVGFLGNHQTLTITAKPASATASLTLKFFVKSVPCNSETQAAFVKQARVFDQEAEFFNKVTPHLAEAVAPGDLEPWGPKCFLANERCVVLEDLRDKGFAMPTTKCLDVDQLKSCAKTMARLHAASILAEKKLGRRLNEMYPQACVEQVLNEQVQRRGGGLLVGSLVDDVANWLGRPARGVADAVDRAFERMRKEGGLRVMCHGDGWSNNLMMDSAEPPKCLLVDFQLVRYANPMVDVAELLYLSSTREVREREERGVIRAYWEELRESLRKCDPDAVTPSLEELTDGYEEARLIAIVIALTYFPVVLLSKEVLAEYKDDPEELHRKIVFRRNNDFILEQMEKDAMFSKMITDVVLEIIEMSDKMREDSQRD